MAKVYLHSLGCAKNTVNSEQMLALLAGAGFELLQDAGEADAAIVNTCGFIDSAKSEAIDAILALAELKKTGVLKVLIVCGCLAERYGSEFESQLPEVDAVLGVGSYTDIVDAVKTALSRKSGDMLKYFAPRESAELDGARLLTSPPYWAWLRIAEGCDNRCAYCAIPDIRGKYRSRRIESIVNEARTLAENGVKELIVIAQDTTRYGLDLYGERLLPKLLTQLESIPGIEWIRLHYLYPDEISEELLDTVAQSKKILRYFDIPIQHISSNMLAAMNRRGDGAFIRALFDKIRSKMPDAVIRTSLIVGFPGETEQDFDELYDFLRQYELERVGIFCYSQEEGTPAGELECQIDAQTSEYRRQMLYDLQEKIMDAHGQSMVGRTVQVLCCGEDSRGMYGRSYMDSPDIDGAVYFRSGREGEMHWVKITHAEGCDLFGENVQFWEASK